MSKIIIGGGGRNPITGGHIITGGGYCFPTNRWPTGGCIPSADAITPEGGEFAGTGGGGPGNAIGMGSGGPFGLVIII